MSKTVVIGLDGATWDLIKPWIDDGELPTFKKLMETGVWGNLESTIPHYTGPAWVSFATGKNPGKHGIFDFVKFKGKTYDLEIINSNDIKSKTYYEYLSEQGYRSILINLPLSYPPKKIDGVIITSLLTQDAGKMVYPIKIKSKYSDLFKRYKIFPESSMSDPISYLKEVSEIERVRYTLAKELFLAERWDHFFLLFSGTDWISHCAIGYLQENDNEVKDVFINQFREIDNYIEWFLENMDDETNIFLMSDHGSTCRKNFFCINDWLWKKGYATITLGVDGNPFLKLQHNKNIHEIHMKSAILNKIIRSSTKSPIMKMILTQLGRILQNKFKFTIQLQHYEIDKANSKSFCPTFSTLGIYINNGIRFENGKVDNRNEFNEVRENIIRELNNLRDTFTGEKLFEHIWGKEEIYQGPFTGEAPDIVILPTDGISFTTDVNLDSFVHKGDNKGGCHNLYGIFLAYGPDIKKGVKIENAKIYDIAPTLLHLFGLPIPKNTDGKVLKEIFREDCEVAKREIEYQEADEKEKLSKKIKKLKNLSKI